MTCLQADSLWRVCSLMQVHPTPTHQVSLKSVGGPNSTFIPLTFTGFMVGPAQYSPPVTETQPQPVPSLGGRKMEWMQRSLPVRLYWENRGAQKREQSWETENQKVP